MSTVASMKQDDLLEQVRKMLEAGKAAEAMEMLGSLRDDGVWLRNARAVCLMRLGRAEEAGRSLKTILFRHDSAAARADAPEAVKLNYATAMLLTGNVAGAQSVLEEVLEDTPAVWKLRGAIKAWRRRLPLHRRLATMLGAYPYDTPVSLDFPPGEL